MISVTAQSSLETVRKSRKVKDEITLIIKNTTSVEFLIDDQKKEKTLDTIDYFKVVDKEFRVYADFVNPLKYRLNVSNKELDDELYKASQDYLSTAIEFLGKVQKIRKTNEKAFTKMMDFDVTIEEKTYSFQLEPKFAEMYLLVLGNDKDFLKNNVSFLQTLNSLDFAEAKKEILQNFDQAFISLEGIKNIKNIENVKTANKALLEKNNARLQKLKTAFKAINIDDGTIKSSDVLTEYITHVVTDMGKEIQEFEEEMETLSSKYKKIEELFSDIQNKKKTTSENSFLVKPFPKLKKSKRYELTVSIEKITFNQKDKTIKVEETQKYVLHVRRFRLFTPVVSSGLLYTDLTFKQYGTDENAAGNTILTESKDKVSSISVAAYLNMYVENKWELPVFLQIGFGTSTERPLFFLGGGFTLSDRLNISGGGIFTWFPKLNDLTLGQEILGTSAIQDDITFDFDTKPRFYIGINFDIGKK
jgi:hypothetical protein